MNDLEKLDELRAKRACCSELLVRMGLWLRGEENEQLATASRALCVGMQRGLCCGALAGGAMMLELFDPTLAEAEMTPALVDWFREAYADPCGGFDCESLTDGDRLNRTVRCPRMIEETYKMCRELLADYDLLQEEDYV